MEQTGSAPVGGPNACPFVALEFDRDRRSDRPDYRHRCYAEPTPAPRAIAHQDQYCLSPRFATCPIFQDWATRAAARPLPANAVDQEQPAAPQAPASAMPAAGAATPPEPDGEQQLAAFETEPPAGAEVAEGAGPGQTAEPGQIAEPAQGSAAAPGSAPAQGSAAAQAAESPPAGEPAEPAAPPFLSGRSARPAMPVSADPAAAPVSRATSEAMRREDVVPSWEIDGRYGAQEPRQRDGRGQQIMTIVAVVVILALGVAAVFIIPGLLAGGPGASPSSQASLPPGASASASPPSSLEPSLQPSPTTMPSVTPAPTPEVTFRTYRVKKGDTLLKIARRFSVNVDDLLAANPQITDPNHIEPGQTIVIPQPAPSASP